MNQGKLELLAPAGKWDVLETVIEAGADAVYLGSKKHNMRMFRQDFNFSDEEIEAAVKYAHERGVNIYVTVNNLLFDEELEELQPYLKFLSKVKPDALIIQDIGLAKLIRDLGINIPLHSSVMMNTHSEPAIKMLEEFGVSRVILSREISLVEARELLKNTGMELEYFIHGDMCVCQSGQCYHSGMVFGESSNRGRCKKPCRWSFDLWDKEEERIINLSREKKYPLAVKDMCMLPFIPELSDSGICSLKIEGRMRTAEYLRDIVSVYRRHLDKFNDDPVGYSLDPEDFKYLHKKRIRDYSTLYAFKNPGPSSIGYSGEREPRFFSSAVREKEIKDEDIGGQFFEDKLVQMKDQDKMKARKKGAPPRLAVRTGSIKGMVEAVKNDADLVYIGGESFNSSGGRWTGADLYYGVNYCREAGVDVVVTTPRITQGREVDKVRHLLEQLEDLKPSGIMAANLGTLYQVSRYSSLPLYGDFSLNVINSSAVELLKKLGVKQLTVQPETRFEHAVSLLQKSSIPYEFLAHGPLTAMIMDHCLPAALLQEVSREDVCSYSCREKKLSLLDHKGQQHEVEVDEDCRNHIFLANELALLPFMQAFIKTGAAGFRLDLRTYPPEKVGPVTALYHKQISLIIENPEGYRFEMEDWRKLKSLHNVPYGFGGYLKGVKLKDSKIKEKGKAFFSSRL